VITQAKPSVLVFARVRSGYDFISSTISAWGDSIAKPPNKYPGCADKGGFYFGDVLHNCMWFEDKPYNCESKGNEAHAGVTGNIACCACGGGTKESTPTPSPKLTRGGEGGNDVDPPRKYKVCS